MINLDALKDRRRAYLRAKVRLEGLRYDSQTFEEGSVERDELHLLMQEEALLAIATEAGVAGHDAIINAIDIVMGYHDDELGDAHADPDDPPDRGANVNGRTHHGPLPANVNLPQAPQVRWTAGTDPLPHQGREFQEHLAVVDDAIARFNNATQTRDDRLRALQERDDDAAMDRIDAGFGEH